tara:strand:- start:499 stop:720 length:222 start_codon:yes stop_codon:yes gene_type:complete
MKVGDLVKFIEREHPGNKRVIYGIVVEETHCNDKEFIYRIRWFDEESNDSWHTQPSKETGTSKPKDLFVISEA